MTSSNEPPQDLIDHLGLSDEHLANRLAKLGNRGPRVSKLRLELFGSVLFACALARSVRHPLRSLPGRPLGVASTKVA